MTVSLAGAMRDPQLLGGAFQAPSFWPWHAVAKLISGERLDRRELALYRRCTGRAKVPTRPVHRLTIVVGRRGGKDRFASAAAVHVAALAADWGSVLSPGESATVLLLGTDRKQAQILKRYCLGLLRAPLLAPELVRETGDIIEFRNGAALEIATNDVRLVRGRSAIAVLGTEAAFWRTDQDSASSDEEVVAAAEPSMAMTPGGGLMILFTSAYRKRGLVYDTWKRAWGRDDADEIVWVAPSRVMNPALPKAVIERAMARDPSRARAEYLSLWREDIDDLIPADVIDGATDRGVIERAPEPGIRYTAFTDAAGGTGQDSFTLGIAHRNRDGSAILDVLRERRPRFVPAAVVSEFADVCRAYRCASVTGDRYAAAWCSDEWSRNGIKYVPSERTASEIHVAGLPLLLAGRARLLDSDRLRTQLGALERRVHAGGRESVDHPPSGHDDLAVSAFGSLLAAASGRGPVRISANAMARAGERPSVPAPRTRWASTGLPQRAFFGNRDEL